MPQMSSDFALETPFKSPLLRVPRKVSAELAGRAIRAWWFDQVQASRLKDGIVISRHQLLHRNGGDHQASHAIYDLSGLDTEGRTVSLTKFADGSAVVLRSLTTLPEPHRSLGEAHEMFEVLPIVLRLAKSATPRNPSELHCDDGLGDIILGNAHRGMPLIGLRREKGAAGWVSLSSESDYARDGIDQHLRNDVHDAIVAEAIAWSRKLDDYAPSRARMCEGVAEILEPGSVEPPAAVPWRAYGPDQVEELQRFCIRVCQWMRSRLSEVCSAIEADIMSARPHQAGKEDAPLASISVRMHDASARDDKNLIEAKLSAIFLEIMRSSETPVPLAQIRGQVELHNSAQGRAGSTSLQADHPVFVFDSASVTPPSNHDRIDMHRRFDPFWTE